MSALASVNAQLIGHNPQEICNQLANVAGSIQVVQPAALTAGVRTVNTVVNITANSSITAQLYTPAGATQGVKYKITGITAGVAGVGAFTCTAVDNTGATVATDTSTVGFLIVG